MSHARIFSVVLFTGIVFGAGLIAGSRIQPAEAAPAAAARVYELRTYTTNEGRLDALHTRFSEHTNALFVKHGMTLVGYWTPMDGDAAQNTLVYIVGHESRAQAAENWKAFGADPEWQQVKADSEADGKIVSRVESMYLTPTDYSPLR